MIELAYLLRCSPDEIRQLTDNEFVTLVEVAKDAARGG